ncbi:MAG: multicopper oxidase family protein [Gemmatimonadales bacterium]
MCAQSPAPDLYTIELIGTPELRRFSGTAELRPAPSPFTAAVTREGVHRYTLLVSADSLPNPGSLGPYTTFVVWAAPPALAPMIRLGELPPGSRGAVPVGEIALNRFVVFVSVEPNPQVTRPSGRYVLRGFSPSMRLGAPHLVQAAVPAPEHPIHHANGWPIPPLHPQASTMYMPALAGLGPNAAPLVPDSGAAALAPPVRGRSLLRLQDGDSLRLEAGPVKRVLGTRVLFQYGFNGQQPGPLLELTQGATIRVRFVNRTPWPTGIHWHGIRLDNRSDGVPHVTQPPVAPGDSFRYEVHFPDPGIYWYHPHHREDVQQDLGLYGNLLVRETAGAGYGPADREEVLVLDDLLLDAQGDAFPHGSERATHALMGRFGNLFLINGEPASSYRLRVRQGEVVRFYLTNAANTRTFNVSVPGTRMKLVGADLGRTQREEWVESVVLAPAERYIVDVEFGRPGRTALVNHVQAIDHTLGRFFPEVDSLGTVEVEPNPAAGPPGDFRRLRSHDDVRRDIERYRPHYDRAPDATVVLSLRDRGLPFPLVQLLRFDTLFVNPVEWSGTMPMMDWLATTDQVGWVLRDTATGRENEEIGWRFRVGDLVRLRLVNDRHTLHPMAHPIHLHGQRFLVLAVNGRRTENLMWKDTVLVPVGSVIELLVELTNPGRWMLHCHIAEHLEAGMKTVVTVSP